MSTENMFSPGEGMISIVGAGPGDPELLTLKGRDRISRCEVLLYDYLVDERILNWVRKDCELICVGKRPGMHSAEQAVINRILIEKAKQRKHVVRLKGGDPFVFGRGGEEVCTIREWGVPFEIIPGITAGVAAAASLAQPLTHREHASTLLFVTGHEDPEKHRPRINWRNIVVENSTIVIYMGMKHLRTIVGELLAAGKDPDTPAAVVQWISTARERQLRCHLKDLAGRVEAESFAPPSVVIIGQVLGD